VLFNEPKLLKFGVGVGVGEGACDFSALQRAEIAEMRRNRPTRQRDRLVSVLFNEPKLLKSAY